MAKKPTGNSMSSPFVNWNAGTPTSAPGSTRANKATSSLKTSMNVASYMGSKKKSKKQASFW